MARRLDWTPAMVNECRALHERGYTYEQIAEWLRTRPGCECATTRAVENALRRPVREPLPPLVAVPPPRPEPLPSLTQAPSVKEPPQNRQAEVNVPAPTPIRPPEPVPAEGLIAILADLHAPEIDEAAFGAALAWIAANRPACVVLAGDIGEWESCSQHGTSPRSPSFLADCAAVISVLRRVRAAALGARMVFLEGNHETRLSRYLISQAPAVYGALTVPAMLELDAVRCEWVPEDRQPFSIGTLDIIHGHQLGGRPSTYYARRLCDVYGSPGRTVVGAHGHKGQMHRRPMAAGHAEGVSVACLRQLQAGWLHGEVSGWTHGLAIGTMREGHRTALELLDIQRGSFCWGGRVYSGAAARAA